MKLEFQKKKIEFILVIQVCATVTADGHHFTLSFSWYCPIAQFCWDLAIPSRSVDPLFNVSL